MTLHLGEGLALPANEAITQKYGFIGRSGSGKSYAAMKLAELFLQAGGQVIALDWVGIWWSLRLAANSKAPGFEHVYIFGGEHADVDLKPESGALMADLVVDKHISVVLDVMHFRKAERTRFATAFAEQFFHRKKTARTACHLFIEEAQAYLPQMVRGDEARMVGVFEDIGKVGRNYGIGTSLISQRPQAINKDVLNQVEVLLAFQTNGPQERKAIAGWTAQNTDAGAVMVQDLPKLRVGHALVWSPQWLRVAQPTHILKRDTYDASSTPTQQAKAIKPKTLAKADLEQLGAEIAATIEKAKADDPRELRKELARVRQELAQAQRVSPSNQQASKASVQPGLTDADRALLDKVATALTDIDSELASTLLEQRVSAAQAQIEKIVEAANRRLLSAHTEARQAFQRVLQTKGFQKILDKLEYHKNVITPRHPAGARVPVDRSSAATRPAETRAPRAPVGPGVAANPDPSVGSGGLRRILIALAQRQQGLTLRQIGVRAGLSSRSGTFSTYMSRGRQAGWIADGGKGGASTITEAGLLALGSYEPLPEGRALFQYYLGELGASGAARILQALMDVAPNTLTAEELGERADLNPRSGTFSTYLSRLRTLELIESGRGWLRVSEELFG